MYTETALRQRLRVHDVSFDSWGEHGTQPLKRLLYELNNGMARLEEEDGEKLVRVIRASTVRIFYRSADTLQLLWGTLRDTHGYESALSSRLRELHLPGEDAPATVQRIFERLTNASIQIRLVQDVRDVLIVEPSAFYPGLIDRVTMNRFYAFMPPQHYDRDGYRVSSSDEIARFFWRRYEDELRA